MSKNWTCPECAALHGEGIQTGICPHTQEEWDLARSLASLFQQPDPTDEQIGYFIEDAASVSDDVGPGPWSIVACGTDGMSERRTGSPNRYSYAFLVNGLHVCAIEDAEGFVEAHYVCTLPVAAGPTRKQAS